MASSSSSISLPVLSSQSWSYDVFLSFRGEDTRKNFVDHLYSALHQSGIHTYKDDVTLPRGETISPALLKAIEESQIAIIVFSENYANSRWCLDELTHIMKCRDDRKQIVMPLFYDVEPTEVRKHTGKYKEAFDKHELENKNTIQSWVQAVVNDLWRCLCVPLEENQIYREATARQELENKAKVESWRKALVEASNIAGWETKLIANGHEAQGIKQIVGEISRSLNLVTLGANKDLIGIMTRVQGLKSQLQIEPGGVRMVAIWGVGGGGKTTLASSVYYEICSMYDGCCFLENIREESSKNGLKKLQEKIIAGALKQNQVQELSGVEEGRRMIKARLRHKKVLIVLDDVDEVDQLEALVGSRDWFGEGSRIIITTRNEQLPKAHGVDVIQPIILLNNDESVTLFLKYAHRDHTPTEDFEKLSKEVVRYAGRLPLALKVLGSYLCGRDIMQWRSALERLKDNPHKDIIRTLKISYDGLEQDEKDLFLDIACCFRGERTKDVMELLDACGSHSVIGVEVLRQKALIIIKENGYVDMHDVVQEMAHYIVREKHPRNPEKYSRVWKKEDVQRILDMAETKELDNIEAINVRGIIYKDTQRFLQVAGNMTKLRWINLNLSNWSYKAKRDKNIVPLPSNFPPPQLCYLYVDGCILQKQLWEGYKHLPNLTYMKLHDMPNLIKIPDFSGLPNLQHFELIGCPCLEEIHPSIGQLENLVLLSVTHCSNLMMFPSITRIKKLETFQLERCAKLVKFSEFQELQQQETDNLPQFSLDLPQFSLDHSGKEVASSSNSWNSSPPGVDCEVESSSNSWNSSPCICCSSPPGVDSYLFHYYLNPRRLQFSHSTLRKLYLMKDFLVIFRTTIDVGELPNLEELDLCGNELISSLGFSNRLPRLKYLKVSRCVPEFRCCLFIHLPSSISFIKADNCKSLKSFGDVSNCKWLWNVSIKGENKLDQCGVDTLINSMLQTNASNDHFMSVALGKHHQFPNKFMDRFFWGYMCRLHLPDNWYEDSCGFLICIVTDNEYPYPKINITMKQEDTPFAFSQEESDEAMKRIDDLDKITYVGYVPFSSLTQTTLLSSSYNSISVIIKNKDGGFYGGIKLIPTKSKSDEVQKPDCSGYWDTKPKTFRIQQWDAKSSMEILWKP